MIKIYRGKTYDKRAFEIMKWLEQHSLEYEVISKKDLTGPILKQLLSLSDNGFESILVDSYHVKLSLNLGGVHTLIDFETVTTDAFVQYLLMFPSIIRTPIVFNEKTMLVGFSSYEIRRFIPRERRRIGRKSRLGKRLK